ncbi:MAG: aspartate 1-decarboxylase [Chloroflexi bacterium]|nr:aspartate 1-decarboxylase [Chloroflexota bacterium]
MREMLKSKIHRARVTSVNVDYEGSISIDRELMEAADIFPFEKVHVLDVENGSRFETYAIEAEKGSGTIMVNGAAARLVASGDTVIILSYATLSEEEARSHTPALVYVDAGNSITHTRGSANRSNELLLNFHARTTP